MKNLLLLRIIADALSFTMYYTGILPGLLKIFKKEGLYVFNYHTFNTYVNEIWQMGDLFTSKYGDNFEKQIHFFNRHFHKLENFDLESDIYGTARYCLTFDDGYRDNFTIALPIIKKYGIPAIFFVSTSVIGSDEMLWYDKVRFHFENNRNRDFLAFLKEKGKCRSRLRDFKQMTHEDFVKNLEEIDISEEIDRPLMMNWEEVREARESGIMIGSHTHAHPILANRDVGSQKEEIEKSVELIKKNLNFTPFLFAYPEGSRDSFNSDTIDILKKSGFRYAFTTIRGVNTASTSPYHLRRIGINPKDSIPLVALKVLAPIVLELKKRNRWKEARVSIEQYGWRNSLIRLLKKIGSVFGFRLETYYILHRILDKEIQPLPLPEGARVEELAYEDFQRSDFFHLYPQRKTDLYKQRFTNQAFQAFGVWIKEKLVYITWIATDFLRVEKISLEKRLKNGEGVLVDSFALPEARKLGIHNYMNGFRLRRLWAKGVQKVYAAVLAENVPALRTQIKHGFIRGEKITRLKLWKMEKYYKKRVHFESKR